MMKSIVYSVSYSKIHFPIVGRGNCCYFKDRTVNEAQYLSSNIVVNIVRRRATEINRVYRKRRAFMRFWDGGLQ